MRRIVVLTLALVLILVLMNRLRRSPSAPPDGVTGSATSVTEAGNGSDQQVLVRSGIEASLGLEAQAALRRGGAWLLTQQNEAGYWSNSGFPALTGLALWALISADAADEAAVDRAVNYLLSCVHEDGSIYMEPDEERKGGGLPNYNTALSMVALHALGNPDLLPVVQSARAYVAQSQHMGGDLYEGGMGYDPDTGRVYADLSNSYLAYEAMRLTERVGDIRDSGQHDDLDWDAAIRFIERVQNRPESNDQAWASDDEAEYGGFAYRPDDSQAGAYTDEEGVQRLRSYGSMTYAGLLSFIYAQVDRSDPRVQSAFDWTLRNWSLEENPGMGDQGLYYYYHTMAKALAVYGQEIIPLADGRLLNWRTEMVRKLVSLQRIDPETGHGYWLNEEGRWWEADPVLVTSYALIALATTMNDAAPSL